ncbi:MAG: hypothetical protein RR253_04905 [Oscillospiraceae bacterium]
MSIILRVLSIVGYILLALIALIIWLVIVPRHFWIEYDKKDGLTAKVNIAFFKLKLYPLPAFIQKSLEKSQATEEVNEVAEEKGEAEAETKPQKKKSNPFDDIEFSFGLIKQILSAAKGAMKIILRGIYFRDLSFTLPLHGEDGYKTQQLYAHTTTAFYALNIFLQQYLNIYYKSPIFVADFANQHKDSGYFYCKISASPSIMISVAIFALRQYFKIMKNNKKPQEL